MSEQEFFGGDTIKHLPSGETWVVAASDPDRRELLCAGWPCSLGKWSDFALIKRGTDAERTRMRLSCLKGSPEDRPGSGAGARYHMAWREVERLENEAARVLGQTLTFADLRAVNVPRCNEHFHPIDAWTPRQWALAAFGELGEMVNAYKKFAWRKDGTRHEVGDEIADVLIYLDLVGASQGWPAKPICFPNGDLASDRVRGDPLAASTEFIVYVVSGAVSGVHGNAKAGAELLMESLALIAAELELPGLGYLVIRKFNRDSRKRGAQHWIGERFDVQPATGGGEG